MPKRKKAAEPEKENNERWLLTYSDMITLLLALFIMLFAISNVDAQKFKLVSAAFQKTFNPGSVKTASASLTSAQLAALQSGLPAGSGDSSSDAGTGSDSGGGAGDTQGNPLDEVYNELRKYVDENNLDQEITLINSETNVSVRLKGVLMFHGDSYEMLDSSKPILANIETAIAKVYSRVDHITISGHTADNGIHTVEANQLSWSLSTERALAVQEYFIGKGLAGGKLSVEGCSDFHPIAPNNTDDGQQQNRRVEIRIDKKAMTSSVAKTNSTTGSATSSAASSKAASSQGTSQQAASK